MPTRDNRISSELHFINSDKFWKKKLEDRGNCRPRSQGSERLFFLKKSGDSHPLKKGQKTGKSREKVETLAKSRDFGRDTTWQLFRLFRQFMRIAAVGRRCMNMDEKYSYEKLLVEYPDTMSKNQMYRICHISKRTASYLLDSGLIKNKNSGKQTRKYTIRTADVIAYLEGRMKNPEKYAAPKGYYRVRGRHRKRTESISSSQFLTEKGRKLLGEFFEEKLMQIPDVVSIEQISDFTGYSTTSVSKWCAKGYLKKLYVMRKYMIPRSYLLEFMESDHFMEIRRKSDKHMEMIQKFMDEN